jgi:hypothetical protein
MTWGPGPPCHTSWPEARRRRTAAQRACNRPAVMCPFIFAATSGQKGEPSHKERATALRLCAPSSSPKPAVKKANHRAGSMQPPRGCAPPRLRCNQRSNMGAKPTCHAPGAPVTGCRKVAPPLVPIPRLLGAVAEDREDNFSSPVQRLEAPRAWPNNDIKCGGHGPVSRGDRRGSRRDHRRTDSNCINGHAGAASQSPIRLWPHLQAHILPRGGPGGHCRYPKSGVPPTTV